MNNVLIEVQRDYDGVSRTDDTEVMKYGVLVSFAVSQYHITASSAIKFDDAWRDAWIGRMQALVGKTVRWEEYAEGGQTFEEDGKTYALIPWWRLIGVSE